MRLLIFGMHRSGTSLLVRTLEGLGLWAGEEDDFHPPTAHDPEGHREHRLALQLNEAALASIDRTWDHPAGIDWSRLPAARRADVLGAINELVATLDQHSDWVVKDPRLCLTLPLWRERIEPACVLVHRDPLEVARSLHSRDGMSIRAGVELWEEYNRRAIVNSDGLDRLLVHHADLVSHPDRTAAQLHDWLAPRRSGPPPPLPAAAPVRTELVRHHADDRESAASMDPGQRRLRAALLTATANPTDEAIAELSAIAAEHSGE